MKYMLTWTERPQGSPIEYENAQKRILEVSSGGWPTSDRLPQSGAPYLEYREWVRSMTGGPFLLNHHTLSAHSSLHHRNERVPRPTTHANTKQARIRGALAHPRALSLWFPVRLKFPANCFQQADHASAEQQHARWLRNTAISHAHIVEQ